MLYCELRSWRPHRCRTQEREDTKGDHCPMGQPNCLRAVNVEFRISKVWGTQVGEFADDESEICHDSSCPSGRQQECHAKYAADDCGQNKDP